MFLIELNAWEDKWIFLILFKCLQDLGKKKLAKKVSLVLKGNLKKKKVIKFVGNTPILAN